MRKYNKQYRVVSEFDCDDKIPYDHANKRSYNDINFIWCYKGQIRIGRYDKKELRIDVLSSKVYHHILKQFKKEGIKTISECDLDGEGWIVVSEKDVHDVCKICKARRQRATPISPLNKKENLKLWKRSQKWVGTDS